MPKSGCDTPLRGSSKSNEQSVWKIEFTYASTTPSLDKVNSDVDVGIGVANSVKAGSTGVVNIKFPKCNRMRVLSKNLIPPSPSTTGTEYRVHEVTDQVPTSGTANVRFFDLDGTPSAVDPVSGSRYQLMLLLE